MPDQREQRLNENFEILMQRLGAPSPDETAKRSQASTSEHSKSVTCPQCHVVVRYPDDKYCVMCGYKLN